MIERDPQGVSEAGPCSIDRAIVWVRNDWRAAWQPDAFALTASISVNWSAAQPVRPGTRAIGLARPPVTSRADSGRPWPSPSCHQASHRGKAPEGSQGWRGEFT